MTVLCLPSLGLRWGRAAVVAVLAFAVAAQARAQNIETVDLRPFIGPSPFEDIGAAHLLPRGRQVMDGVPFQIDGVVLFDSGGTARTNVNSIPIGRAFERLHLLAATHNGGGDGTMIASVQLTYADQTTATLDLRFGAQMRRWYGQWHQKRDPPSDTNCVEAWDALASDPAKSDNVLRLFHVVLTNPFPAKVVAGISVEKANTRCGLILAAMSVGPSTAQRLTDTVPALCRPIPDVATRSGELAQGRGMVKSEDGAPVAKATVRVMSARKSGVSFDDGDMDDPTAGLQTTTAGDGSFTLPPLPDNRLYSLVIAADGFESFFYGAEDPKFDPIDVRLRQSKAASQAAPKYAVHGRIIGPDGKPMPLVWVEKDGVALAQGRGWGWEREGWPDRVLTDTNGEFTFGRDKMFAELQVRTHAPGMARRMEWLAVTNTVYTIQLGVGATLRGRVVKDGEALAGVRLGVSGSERNSEIYAGHYETSARADGTFEFAHLQTNTAWFLYGIISSFPSNVALGSRQVQTGADVTTNDLGDLSTKPALRLAGVVKTRRGEPLPKGLTVQVGFEGPWDSQSAKVDGDGHFRFDRLYSGTMTVSLRANHWRLSEGNRSLDTWNPFRLAGLLERDKDDLTLEIEKGDQNFNGGYRPGNGQLPAQDMPRGRPIQGYEHSGASAIVLDVQIVDDDTGQLLPRFKVVPGYQPPRAAAPPKPMLQQLLKPFAKKTIPWNELPYWEYRREETVTNGLFSIEYLSLSSQPIFRIEADGYEPYESEPIAASTTNLVVRLRHGVGPNGVVLLPNGEPAENATVVYAAGRESFSFDDKTIGPNGRRETNGEIFQVTGKQGTFSYQPRAQGQVIYVSHLEGWAEEDVSHGGNKLKLRLQPWGTVVGTLVYGSGAPASGAVLGLNLSGASTWLAGAPFIYFRHTSTTDSQGRFEFQGLPPRGLHLVRRVSVGGALNGGYSENEQRPIEVKPNATNDLGKVVFDTPPPLPLGEEIRKKLFGN